MLVIAISYLQKVHIAIDVIPCNKTKLSKS